MKKIAMLGDLHGNLTATLAMEKALKDYHVDEIWFLGDAVGKGPQSRETCDWVRANCTRFVGGAAPGRSAATGIMASAASASPRITISGISWAKSA